MQILRQSTAVDVLIGPFVDLTDGYTAETGESPSVKLSKNGQTLAAKNDATTPVSDADGYYNCELDATDTNTVGTLVLTVAASANALPVRHEFQVLEESAYDSIFASGASDIADILVDTGTTLDTKLDDIQGTTFSSATDSLEAIRNRGDSAWTGGTTTSDSGTAQAGSSTTITLQSGASASNDLYNGQLIFISAGTGAGQSRAIADYVGSTKVATIIGTWAVTPDNTSVYEIYPADIDEITDPPTAATIADAVWDESTTGHTNAGSFGEQLKNDVDAILVDTAELQGDWTDGGRLDLLLDATALEATVAALNDPTAAAIADAVLDEALSGHTTAGTLGKAVADIEADTDELQGDWANGGRLDLLIDDIGSDTDAILNDTGTAGVVLAGTPGVNVTQISGSGPAADNLELSALAVISGTLTGTPTTTTANSSLTGYANDELIGRTIIFLSGAGDQQATDITDYASTSGALTFTAVATAPDNGASFIIV